MPVVKTIVIIPLQDRGVANVGTITTRMAAAQPVKKNAKHVVAEVTSRVCATDAVQPGKTRSDTNTVQAQTSMIRRSSIILGAVNCKKTDALYINLKFGVNTIKLKIDTGVDVMVLSREYYLKMKRRPILNQQLPHFSC